MNDSSIHIYYNGEFHFFDDHWLASLQEARGASDIAWGARLQSRDFSMIRVDDADFENMDLAHADFSGAALPTADFSGAVLSDSTSYRSDLTLGEFCGADLQRVDFRHAELCRADFSSAEGRTTCLADAQFNGANLECASFVDADLRGADLSEANLQHAQLQGAIFDDRTLLPFDRDLAEQKGMIYSEVTDAADRSNESSLTDSFGSEEASNERVLFN